MEVQIRKVYIFHGSQSFYYRVKWIIYLSRKEKLLDEED